MNTYTPPDKIEIYAAALQSDIGAERLEVVERWNRRTPQPVVREQLTDAQIAEMMRDTWGCASIAPRHALEFARAVERAHGITQKGGD